MMITLNRLDKNKTVYKCDRCEIELTGQVRKTIYIGDGSHSPKKKWDLCSRCYRAFERAIERRKQCE